MAAGHRRKPVAELREHGPLDDPTGLRSAVDRQALFEAYVRNDGPAVLDSAAKLLAVNLADIDAHLVAGIAYERQRRPLLAQTHLSIVRELLSAIMTGKTGESAQTAYEALSIPEEHAVLRKLGSGRPGRR